MNLMEVEKTKTTQTATTQESAPEKSGYSVRDFVGEVKAEIHRINWTSKEELQVYTKIVVVATFILGLGIYAVDLVIQTILRSFGTIFHWIAG